MRRARWAKNSISAVHGAMPQPRPRLFGHLQKMCIEKFLCPTFSQVGFSSGGVCSSRQALSWKGRTAEAAGGRWRMVTIAKDNDVVSLINVFTVAPEDQQHLVDVLVDATQAVMRKQPGFVSANIHKSLDGTRVTNYAQWRSREAFEAMLQNQEAAEHMGEAAKIAERFEPHLYEVSFVDEV